MKTNSLLVIVLGLIFILISCDNQEKEPYVIFKDSDAQVIDQDTLEAELTSVQELLIESGYKGSSVKYLRQINNGDIVDITDSTDVELVMHGFSAINFEKVFLTTDISDFNPSVGSTIKITVRLGTDLSKSIYYKVN